MAPLVPSMRRGQSARHQPPPGDASERPAVFPGGPYTEDRSRHSGRCYQDDDVGTDDRGLQRPLGDDEIRVWAEPGGPIMMKAVTQAGDPVELSEGEARKVAEVLVRLADWVVDE